MHRNTALGLVVFLLLCLAIAAVAPAAAEAMLNASVIAHEARP